MSKALQVAEKWIAVDPLSQIARIRYAAALRAVGRHDAARASLKAAVPLASEGELDWYFGQSFLSEHEDETAIRYFESAVRQTLDIEPVWVRPDHRWPEPDLGPQVPRRKYSGDHSIHIARQS